MRNKIQGMLIGGAIGDAWGMPVESMTPKQIAEKHPFGLKSYEPAINHKWLGNYPAGSITDDTFLTYATMQAITAAGGLSMEEMAKTHLEAFKENTCGWGRTTKEAVGLLAKGISWDVSGKLAISEKSPGVGNGILMKCAPLGAYRATKTGQKDTDFVFCQFCVKYAAMTHYNKMAACSGVLHANVIYLLLNSEPDRFDERDFLELVCDSFWKWDKMHFDVSRLQGDLNPLKTQFEELWKLRHDLSKMTAAEIRNKFKTSGYIAESMPFSYAMFAKNPYSAFDAGFDTIHQGGDTDSNAKVVLEMIGALHGMEVFQTEKNEWMTKGLSCYNRMKDSADTFCDKFGV